MSPKNEKTRKRQKKPTFPFGYFKVLEGGKLESHYKTLPSEKGAQELEVAKLFIQAEKDKLPDGCTVEPLDEDDHDVIIKRTNGSALAKVKLAEIVQWDYADLRINGWDLALSKQDQPVTIEVSPFTKNQYLAVDTEKRADVLKTKIEGKLGRHYARPSNMELWLLIWSVISSPLVETVENEQSVPSEIVTRAKTWLGTRSGALDFDRIYMFQLTYPPSQIWPLT